MLARRLMKNAFTEKPKKVAELTDIVNLPQVLRDFMGQSQSSQLSCFKRVWDYIKENNLQDPLDKNAVKTDKKLKSIFLGKSRFDLAELPMLVQLHFPKQAKQTKAKSGFEFTKEQAESVATTDHHYGDV